MTALRPVFQQLLHSLLLLFGFLEIFHSRGLDLRLFVAFLELGPVLRNSSFQFIVSWLELLHVFLYSRKLRGGGGIFGSSPRWTDSFADSLMALLGAPSSSPHLHLGLSPLTGNWHESSISYGSYIKCKSQFAHGEGGWNSIICLSDEARYIEIPLLGGHAYFIWVVSGQTLASSHIWVRQRLAGTDRAWVSWRSRGTGGGWGSRAWEYVRCFFSGIIWSIGGAGKSLGINSRLSLRLL